MAAPASAYKDRQFIAVIGDEDSVTGLLLAGIGHITAPPDSQKNFLVVDNKTDNQTIESTFDSFTQERKDIAIVLINQHVRDRTIEFCRPLLDCYNGKTNEQLKIAERIRHRVDTYTAAFPSLLEIPSKDHPYDPEKDSVLRRVRRLFGE